MDFIKGDVISATGGRTVAARAGMVVVIDSNNQEMTLANVRGPKAENTLPTGVCSAVPIVI